MELGARRDVPDHPGRVLILDPQWINDTVVRGWIALCDRSHGDRCRSLPLFRVEDSILPMCLVDVLQNCLVRGGDTVSEYIALSYTWEQVTALRNESKICDLLQRPDILTSSNLPGLLPTTIKDAFRVIQNLGYRYLWVDALCIVHDNEEHLNMELSQMHRIYACASFTIVTADDTDANYGLRGLKGLTSSRNLRQEPIGLAGSEQIMQDVKSVRMQDLVNVRHAGKERLTPCYYRRAWTFQENLFSKMQLIFVKDSVRWQCQCANWDEDLLPDDRVDGMSVPFSWRWFQRPLPTLSSLSYIITQYNEKELSFPEDGFAAFSGMQTMLHRTHPSGLLYGHPEFFFDITLTWFPIDLLKRRRTQATPQDGRSPHCIPSWSWTGWAGKLGLPCDHELTIVTAGVVDIEGYCIPVAEWYTMASPSSTERRRIGSKWFKYKTLARDGIADLPSGWRREKYNVEIDHQTGRNLEKHNLPPEVPSHCYKHSSVDDQSQFQWYPIPVAHPNAKTLLRPQTNFLFAQTTRSFFYVGDMMHEDLHHHPGTPRFELVDTQSQLVGYLQLPNNDDVVNFENEPGKIRVELLATCKGYTGKIFDYELALREAQESGREPWNTQLKDCYFGLWIEWEDGVAYRRGSGAVTVEARDKDAESVDLILG